MPLPAWLRKLMAGRQNVLRRRFRPCPDILERRDAPAASASVIGSVLTVEAGSGSDSITLTVDSSNNTQLDVFDNDTLLVEAPLASFTSISVQGGGGNDGLTIDYANGGFSQGVAFDGGSGNSSLTLMNGWFDDIVDNLTGPDAGNLTLTPDVSLETMDTITGSATGSSNPLAWTVSTSNVNQVTVDSSNMVATLNLPAGADDAALQHEQGADNSTSQLASLNGAFQTTSFANPYAALALNFGAGDTVTVNDPEAQFDGSLTLNAGGAGNDTVNFVAPLSVGNTEEDAALTVDASTINIDAPITIGTGNGPGAAIQFNNSGPLTLAADITVSGDPISTIAFAGPVTLAASCTLSAENGSVSFGSNLNLGTSTLDINGGFAIAPPSTLAIELAGSLPGQYGHIQHSGTKNPSIIVITLAPGFVPVTGTNFTLLEDSYAATNLSPIGTPEPLSVGNASFDLVTEYNGETGAYANILSTEYGSVPGPASQVAFLQQPQQTVAGKPQLTSIVIEDANGNVVANDNSTVALTLASGPGVLTGAPLTATAVNGVANFGGVVVSTPGTYVLQASDGELAAATSASFNALAPQPATQLGFAANPLHQVAGEPFDVTVELLDSDGRPTDGSGQVTINAEGDGFSQSLATAEAVNGGVTFSGLVLTQAGMYTFATTAPGFARVVSSSFTLEPAAASQMRLLSNPPSVPAATPIPPFAVALYDSFGNQIYANVPVTVTASGPGTIVNSATTALVDGVTGEATFSPLELSANGTYTLTLSASEVPSISCTVTVGAVADRLAFVQTPATSTPGAIPFVAVAVEDAQGQVVATDPSTITLTVASGPGTLGGSTSAGTSYGAGLNARFGTALFFDLTLSSVGTYTLKATDGSLTPTISPSITVAASPLDLPAQLVFESSPTSSVAGQPLPDLRLDVLDAAGHLVNDPAPITLSVTGAGGSTVETLITYASNDVAVFSGVVLRVAGSYAITASERALAAEIPSVAVSAGSPSQLNFVTQPANVSVGQALPDVSVQLTDAFGNGVSGVPVSVTLAGPGGVLAGTTTAATSVQGLATFTGLSIQQAGQYSLSITTAGVHPLTSSPFTVTVGAPLNLAFASVPSGGGAGQPLPDVKVQVRDSDGNPAPDGTPVTLTISGPNAPAAVTASTSAGVAVFSGLVLEAGTFSMTASSPGLAPVQSNNFTISAAPPGQLTLVTQPGNITAGDTLPSINVALTGSLGNAINGAPVTVALTGGGALTGTTTVTTSGQGTASFTGLSVDKVGQYSLSISTPGLNAVVSTPFSVTAAAAASLVFASTPSGGSAGQTLPDITVKADDAYGNPAPDGTAVTLTISGPNAPAAVTASTSAGVAVFSGLVLEAGTFSMTASLPGLAPVQSNSFAISAMPPALLTLVTQPANITAGDTLPSINVALTDSLGNASSGAPVTVGLAGGGTLTGTTTVTTSAQGTASFTGLSIDNVGQYALSISTPGVNAIVSHPFTVTAAGAAGLTITAAPGIGTAGQALSAVRVTVADAYGNPTPDGTLVTLTVSGPDVPAPATAPTSGGVAVFSSIILPQAGTYSLTATVSGLVPVQSASFTVNPAPSRQLLLVTQPTDISAGQTLPNVDVQLTDAFGNAVGGVPITTTLTGSGGVLLGTTTVNSSAQGTALFTGLSIQQVGQYSLSVAAPGVGSVTSNSFHVTAAAAASLEIAAAPSAGSAGQALADIRVGARDAYGNPAPDGTPVMLTIHGPNAPAPMTAPTSGGVAVFSGVVLNTAGAYSLTATAPGCALVQSSSFTIAAGAAGQLTLQSQPTDIAAGQALPDLDVQLSDAFGNAINGIPVTVTLTGRSGVLLGVTTFATADQGTATFTGLVIEQAGQYTLTLAAPGVQPISSHVFDVTAAAVAGLDIAAAPASGIAGQALSDVRVEAHDAYGNPAPDGTPITLIVGGLNAPAPITTWTVGGVAVFTGLMLSQAGSYRLTAITASAAPVVIGGLTIEPAPTPTDQISNTLTSPPAPAQVVVSAPTMGRAGKLLRPLKLQVRDATGLPVSQGTVVRVRLRAGRLTGRLQARTDDRGDVTFTSLSIARPGQYTLEIYVSGLEAPFVRRLTILRR
jgi:hypothetical protein